MSILHSDYYIASFATPPKKTKFNAFSNKKSSLWSLWIEYIAERAYIYFVALLLEEIQIAIPYRQHLNFEAAVSLVCSSLQISVLRIGAVIFYCFFVQHMRRARNWWDSGPRFVNSSRVDTGKLWCKKDKRFCLGGKLN